MRAATFAIEALTIDDTLWGPGARLRVHQSEPAPGVHGLIDWSISATLGAQRAGGPAVIVEARLKREPGLLGPTRLADERR
jgi:hypothetical protein